MENRTLKILISCALGAGIGALIALQMSHYFWWVGMLAGGFVGYISYEFKEVTANASIAWKLAYRCQAGVSRKKIYEWFITLCRSLMLFCIIVMVGMTLFLSLVLSLLGPLIFVMMYGKLIGFMGSLAIFILATPILTVVLKDVMEYSGDIVPYKVWNPISLFCWYYPKHLGIVMFRVATRVAHVVLDILIGIPKVILTVYLFVKYLFILIHSDIRLLCGIDAAIGASVGYFAGSAIIGAIAGGAFGVINYEIISKRVLKLAPMK